MGESILWRNDPKVIYNYSGVTPFGRIQFFSFVLFMIFFSFLLRKGYYWFSWDRIWKNRCICTASSSDTARKSSEVICSRSYSDKVRLGPMLVLHKDYTYLYTSHIYTTRFFLPFLFCRELAFQISEQFEALGSTIGVKCGKCCS